MKIGLPKEIKDNEYRVGLTPAGVQALSDAGHELFVQKTAGEGSGFSDEQYIEAGATMIATADEVWQTGDMIVKVKETDCAGISAYARKSTAFHVSSSRAGI